MILAELKPTAPGFPAVSRTCFILSLFLIVLSERVLLLNLRKGREFKVTFLNEKHMILTIRFEANLPPRHLNMQPVSVYPWNPKQGLLKLQVMKTAINSASGEHQ